MILALVAALSVGQSEVNVDARMSVYTDSDQTTVVSPFVAADAPVGDATISAGYTADVITTASVDIRTAASPKVVHDTRHQASVGYSQKFADTTIAAGYIFSEENDYLSNGANLGITQDLFEKNITLGLTLGYEHNLVWRANDPAGAQPFDVGTLGAVYTQVLGPRIIASVNYDLVYGYGYQASPYRYVFISIPSDPGRTAVLENDPPLRVRNAFTGKVAQALSDIASLQADYRFYVDSWGLVAHTLSARLILEPGSAWTIRFTARGYFQQGASFYQPVYTEPLQYMTAGRELCNMWSVLGGAKITYNYPTRGTTRIVSFDAKVDLLYIDYLNFPSLPYRIAEVYEVGMNLRF
jgi:hypothetical protein